ncbi:MAG: metabolite traffic protein EboE [Verrucomicrobiota bacterium]|nr:metabolite traffic protein EboE [Verrucomicrobiota bacterium]
MQLKQGIHLAYCTNIHRGETWAQTFDTLKQYALGVRDQVSSGKPYAIGLRLGDQTSRELSDPQTLLEFRRWLDRENCYVFTINGFPYGRFHGGRVKEHVYEPDWTTVERVEYTKRLFDLLVEIAPPEVGGSVSTVPCSFKPFIKNESQIASMRRNLWLAVEHIAALCEKTGRDLHLGLEPEPLCFLETSDETVDFINSLREEHPNDPRLPQRLGVNYDACHLAVEYESPQDAIGNFLRNNIRISKLHFSSALKVRPTLEARAALRHFVEPVYFHQVIARKADGSIERFIDLDIALDATSEPPLPAEEWRVHFHVPLHCQPGAPFETTSDHIQGVLDILAAQPSLCSHIEMETYTWEVLPGDLKKRNVVHQLVAEYRWTLAQVASRGLV